MMFTYIATMLFLAVATYLIARKFGLWAGLVVGGAHMVNISVDWFVEGNLTGFRFAFYMLYSFLLLMAYIKTVKKLNL